MVEDGYSAVTSRRVAEQADLKSQLVHYYFASMEDLFVALYERSERVFLERHLQAVSSDNPLRALWDLCLHPQRTRLSQEFIALANRRKSIAKISARVMERLHSVNEVFIAKYLQEAGLDPADCPPLVVSHLINGLSRDLVSETAVGITRGHAEIRAYVEQFLDRLESQRRENRQLSRADAVSAESS